MSKALKLIESLKAKHAESGRNIEQLEGIFLVHAYLDEQGIEFEKNSTIGVQCIKFDEFHVDRSIFNIRVNDTIITQLPFDRVPHIYIDDSIKEKFTFAKRRYEKKRKEKPIPECFNIARAKQIEKENHEH